MRRATLALGLALSTVAATLAALVYGIGAHRSSSAVEPGHGEARVAQLTSSTETEPKESTEKETDGSTGVVRRRSTDSDQKLAVTEALSDLSRVEQDAVRKKVRETATRRVQTAYSLLIEELDLTPQQKEALVSLLIEDQIAGMETPYSRSQDINEHERANRIAAIIGDSRLRQFLALERNLPVYWEAKKISSMLQQNGVPLADTQRDGLLKILTQVRKRYQTTPRSDVKPRGIDYLEYRLAQIDDYERHVIELAPSVLSPEQVRYLFEQYQYLSNQRADALEAQREARADPMTEDLPLFYPLWGD